MLDTTPIAVRILDVRPHPDQATCNPDDWAIQFEVTYDGTKRTFWRWYTARARLSINKQPTPGEIIRRFWGDMFAELHGFAFDEEA
jgi:hypothetical protein